MHILHINYKKLGKITVINFWIFLNLTKCIEILINLSKFLINSSNLFIFFINCFNFYEFLLFLWIILILFSFYLFSIKFKKNSQIYWKT